MKYLFQMTLFVVLSTATHMSAANSPEIQAFSIPASACSVYNSEMADLVRLQRGAWAFRPGITGRAVFHCPFPFTYVEASGNYDQFLESFRVWFRDGDTALGGRAKVSVQFMGRIKSGHILAFGPNHTVRTMSDQWGTRTFSLDHNLGDRLYSFKIEISRSNSDTFVGFAGIDFLRD